MKTSVFFLAALMSAFMFVSCSEKETPAAQPEQTAAVGESEVIRLNVFFTANEDTDLAELKAIADSLVAASRTDEGCLSYDFYESTTTPRKYMIVETWVNDSLLGIHSRAPHFEKYVPQLQERGVMTTQRFAVTD